MVSLSRPARGCNEEGSAKADGLRKASTPWPSVGSNAAVVGYEGGGGVVVWDCGFGWDLRPVKVSQIEEDMLAEVILGYILWWGQWVPLVRRRDPANDEGRALKLQICVAT